MKYRFWLYLRFSLEYSRKSLKAWNKIACIRLYFSQLNSCFWCLSRIYKLFGETPINFHEQFDIKKKIFLFFWPSHSMSIWTLDSEWAFLFSSLAWIRLCVFPLWSYNLWVGWNHLLYSGQLFLDDVWCRLFCTKHLHLLEVVTLL